MANTWTMLRTAVLGSALAIGFGASQASADDYLRDVGNWSLYTWEGNSGQNEACYVEADYRSGVTLYVFYTPGDGWELLFKNPEWRLRTDDIYPVDIEIDRMGAWEADLTALSDDTVSVYVNEEFISEFKRGYEMRVDGRNQDLFFELTGTTRAVNAVSECVRRHVATGGGGSNPFGGNNSSSGSGYSGHGSASATGNSGSSGSDTGYSGRGTASATGTVGSSGSGDSGYSGRGNAYSTGRVGGSQTGGGYSGRGSASATRGVQMNFEPDQEESEAGMEEAMQLMQNLVNVAFETEAFGEARYLEDEEHADVMAEYHVRWLHNQVFGAAYVAEDSLEGQLFEVLQSDGNNCYGTFGSMMETTLLRDDIEATHLGTVCQDPAESWQAHYTLVPVGNFQMIFAHYSQQSSHAQMSDHHFVNALNVAMTSE